VFADYRLETFAEHDHFDPPHLAELKRLAARLLEFWERSRPATR
jgi:hypothetical protein